MTSPIASGRDADVYAISDDRVLRRYRAGGDVTAEAAVMVHVARHGFPVPAVYHAAGADLVMARLDGPTMLAALRTGEVDPASAGRTLADLHDRLGRVPALAPGKSVLHLDLHPDNVLLGPHGPVVIDWRNTREGPHDLDVAMSALILAQVAVADEEPASAVLTALLASVDARPLDRLDEAVGMRGADKNMTAEELEDLPRAAELTRTAWRRRLE
jgi:Ser/Thr protein kinase RdoA (MazF antagonist)